MFLIGQITFCKGGLAVNDGYFEDGNPGDHIVIQYTGLKDKNGKEIYEGDIVCGETTLPMEILWYKYMWAVKYKPVEGETVELFDEEFMIFMESENWEIIGNIFENPELLAK